MANQDGMIKDRGNIKWTAMMLPEHRGMLHELGRKQLDVDPPSKSGDELAELAEKIAWALQDEHIVTIVFWLGNRKRSFTGKIMRIDPREKAVMVEGLEGEKSWILAQHIFDLQ